MLTPLKKARMEKGLTQWQVAQQIGISERMIGYWERNRQHPSTKQCFLLSKILEASVEILFPDRFGYNK